MLKIKCQACNELSDEVVMVDVKVYDNVHYHLCANCFSGLSSLNFTKKQFKNLLKNGHKVTEFYLHCDFYSPDGEALQPDC